MARPASDVPVTDEPLRLTLVTSSKNLPLSIRPAVPPTDDELYEMCQANRLLRIERTAQGELLIMPPTGGKTGHQPPPWRSAGQLGRRGRYRARVRFVDRLHPAERCGALARCVVGPP